MPATHISNGAVWKITTGALTLFLVLMAAMWGMVGVHASTLHNDSTPRTEFELFQGSVDGRLERIERKLDQLLEK